MATFCSVPFANAGMAASQQICDFEFLFTGKAIATNGSQFALLSGQASAGGLAYLAIGLGDVSTAVMTAAQAAVFATPEGYQAIQVPQSPTNAAEVAAITTGLVNHMAQIEANADGADSVAFCVKIPCVQVLAVTLTILDASTMNADIIPMAGPAAIIPSPVTLGAASKIILTGTTEIDFDANPLCINVKNQLVFGSFKVIESDNVAPAAGDIIVLKIKAMV